jgi:hypothetical protein
VAFHSSRRSIAPPPRLTVVLAIGQRVFVNSTDVPPRPVALGDETGVLCSGACLIDGAEVEVLAWRPRGASDTRYRVRAADGVDGWLGAGNLRRTLAPPPAPSSPTPAQVAVPAEGDARPFGRRSHVATHSPAPLSSPATAEPSRGRRFGERF